MKILVTGSSGHLGEALMRTLRASSHDARGIDVTQGAFTDCVGSISDRAFVEQAMESIDAVLHTASLHKPHVATHSKQQFVETNISGTLNLLEEAVRGDVAAFVFTSTTSAFGAALTPPPGEPAAWVDETIRSVPKNIYGVTKTSAEDLCELFHRRHALNCIILRTSRFFPEEDDSKEIRQAYEDENAKANEFLFRRVDLEDAASAHLAALERAAGLGFGRYIVSAPTPFSRDHLPTLRRNPDAAVAELFDGYQEIYRTRGFRMFPTLDRVYVSARAETDL